MVVESKTKPSSVTKEVFWENARSIVTQVNPKLAHLIDQINPDRNLPFIHAFYPFGESIIHKGNIQLPLNAQAHSASFRSKATSLILPLNKANEVYIEGGDRIVPIELLSPGQIWGGHLASSRSEIMDNSCNNIHAGARSIFMLPKITDATAHQRIQREFALKLPSPKTLWDHAKIFTAIANSPHHTTHWASQILIFTDNWLKQLWAPQKNLAWLELKDYLHESAWLYFESWQHSIKAQAITSIVSFNKYKQRYKLDTSSLDISKHLLNIAAGISPGFCATGGSEMAAPISIIEKAYVEVYGLRNYLPIVMQPSCLNKKQPQYFSLSLPSYFNNSAKPSSSTNLIYQMRQLKKTLDLMISHYKEVDNEHPISQHLEHNFYHTTADVNHNIQLAKNLPSQDPALLGTYYQYPHREFPDASPFVRGCIQILNDKDKA